MEYDESITLLDLISLNELQAIQDAFADAIGIASIITDISGRPITSPSNFSKVCGMVCATAKGEQYCTDSGKALGEKARSLHLPAYQKCLCCGFTDASAPIIVADSHIANWLVGQVNLQKAGEEHIRGYADEIGADAEIMAATFRADPRFMPVDRFEKVLTLLWLLAQKISILAYHNLLLKNDNFKLMQAEKEITYLNQHLEHRIQKYETANAALQQTLARLRKTQDYLIQQEKLASLGSLVAGIAHEINTPVGTSVTAASYLEQETQTLNHAFISQTLKKSDLAGYLANALDATNIILLNLRRASELVLGFKQVAADRSTEKRQVFNVKNCIQAVIVSLRPNLKKTHHEIAVHCDDNWKIESYPGDVSQIITNLMMNSLMHAFPDNRPGKITISAVQHDHRLMLTYTDNGAGIPSDRLNKIFEPFYTTKRGQGGTGLGLHIIHNIVRKLNGSITCTSEPDKKTAFIITIPLEYGGTL